MRNWPSIIPDPSEDYYSVLNSYGRHGAAFAETDLDRADLETTITNLMSGQHCYPLRVIMFNPETNRAEDVSHAIAQEILRRLGLEGRNVSFNAREVRAIFSPAGARSRPLLFGGFEMTEPLTLTECSAIVWPSARVFDGTVSLRRSAIAQMPN